MKFRKKPVVIDAWKLDIANVDETMALYGKIYNTEVGSMLEVATLMKAIINVNGIPVPTPNNVSFLYDGDWLIQDVNGKFYTCKPDIFEKTYEAVNRIS